ncbi:MAG: hypothetical protein HC836_37090 [Richelia sp. RM2_1_2]|nr:hypothetical protein [Richelia sp. RM2_1_2]
MVLLNISLALFLNNSSAETQFIIKLPSKREWTCGIAVDYINNLASVAVKIDNKSHWAKILVAYCENNV